MTERERAATLWLIAIVALGLLARSIVVLASMDAAGANTFEYDRMARNLLAGRGYVYDHLETTYHAFYSGAPFVLLLAAAYAVSGGSTIAAVALQSLSSAALAVTIFAVARRFGGDNAGWVAAVLVMFHPGFAFYDTRNVHSLSFDALAIALTVLTLFRLREAPSIGTAVAGGLAFGIAFLQRATMVLVPVVGLVWLLRTSWRGRGRVVPLAVAYALAALVVVTPLVARNWVVLGKPVLSTTAAESLWRGNVADSLGGSYLASGRRVFEADSPFHAALLGRPEIEQARMFQSAALAGIRTAPGAFVIAIMRKISIFWFFGPMSGFLYPAVYFYVYLTYYAIAVALAVVGIRYVWASRARRPGGVTALELTGAVAISVSLVQSVFYVELRHRWGVEPLLLGVSAVGVSRLWQGLD